MRRNFKYQMGGPQQEDQGPTPVQVEKGEKILLPSGDIVSTAAKKRHKNMRSDVVTDLLSQNSYVFSDTSKMKLSKNMNLGESTLGDLTLGYSALDYEENKSTPMPKEITFGDLIKKNKFTPAEYAGRIASKYPTTEREQDAFANKANEENKESRLPYLMVLTKLSEMMKKKREQQGENSQNVQNSDSPKPMQQPMQQYGGLQHYKYGGSIHIAKNKRGTFKAQASRMGMGTREAASHILAHKGDYSSAMIKKAVFAHNFAKQYGGLQLGQRPMNTRYQYGGRDFTNYAGTGEHTGYPNNPMKSLEEYLYGGMNFSNYAGVGERSGYPFDPMKSLNQYQMGGNNEKYNYSDQELPTLSNYQDVGNIVLEKTNPEREDRHIESIKNSLKELNSTAKPYSLENVPQVDAPKAGMIIRDHDKNWDYKIGDDGKIFTQRKGATDWIDLSKNKNVDYNLVKQRLTDHLAGTTRQQVSKATQVLQKLNPSLAEGNQEIAQQGMQPYQLPTVTVTGQRSNRPPAHNPLQDPRQSSYQYTATDQNMSGNGDPGPEMGINVGLTGLGEIGAGALGKAISPMISRSIEPIMSRLSNTPATRNAVYKGWHGQWKAYNNQLRAIEDAKRAYQGMPGEYKSGGNIPKYQWEALVGPALSLFDSLGIFGTNTSAKNQLQEDRAYQTNLVNQNNATQNDLINKGNDIGMAGAVLAPLTQDPRYTVGNYGQQISGTGSTYDQLLARDEANKGQAQNMALANSGSALRNLSALGLSPSQSMNYANQLHTSGINSANESDLKYNQIANGHLQNRLTGMNHYYDIQSAQAKDKANIERTNRNKIAENFVTGPTGVALNTNQNYRQQANNFLGENLSIYGTTANALMQNSAMANERLYNNIDSLADKIAKSRAQETTYNPGSGNYNIPGGPSSPYDPNDPYYNPNDPYNNAMYGKFGGFLRKRKLGGRLKRK